MENERIYAAIDLKSFYASVECVERGLNPLTAHLVVADESRTEKTICLAVSPALKAYGIPGRARLFEVVQRVRQINRQRKQSGEEELRYIAAPPRMQLYLNYSRRIYDIYLQYVAEEDIHKYSVDEVFIDLTDYMKLYKTTAHELVVRMIKSVLEQTGITATAGIGTNLYLAKVAMDIVAKHEEADEDGVRIAELDEMSYRRRLWNHKPLTSFWRVGHGIADRLAQYNILTMGQLARTSLQHGEWLYQQFGINAELLIDHAWGYEPCTIAAIKAYKPGSNSLSRGQVLKEPYTYQKAETVILEMADSIVLELVEKGLVTDQIVLSINYDSENLTDPVRQMQYHGATTRDYYGRVVPKHAHGSMQLGEHSASTQKIMQATKALYERITNPDLLIRRLTITCNHVVRKEKLLSSGIQLDLFAENRPPRDKEREERLQKTILDIKQRYGKNAILKGINYGIGATGRERNGQIGGHKS